MPVYATDATGPFRRLLAWFRRLFGRSQGE
jgi:hypothetical protein